MKEKVEGTIVIDGLLEGRLPEDPSFPEKLREWTASAGEAGWRFNLDVTGNSFSVLPDAVPLDTRRMGPRPEETLSGALGRLVGALPPEGRRALFSTLRSVEYRKGEEVQSLYLIGPSGSVDVKSRAVEASTVPSPQPLRAREVVRLTLLGLLLVGALLGLSSFFVDWRRLFGEIADTVRPIQSSELTVDATAFDPYLTVSGVKYDSAQRAVIVELKRSESFPKDEAELARAWARTGDSLPRRFALEALAKGYVRCELFDAAGEFLGFTTQRLRAFGSNGTAELAVPVPERRRPARVVVTY